MTLPVWAALSLALSVSALVYVLTTTRRIAKQRDNANARAQFWHDRWAEAHKELEELKNAAEIADQNTRNGHAAYMRAKEGEPDGLD